MRRLVHVSTAALLLTPLLALAALTATFSELFPATKPGARRSTGGAIEPVGPAQDRLYVYGGFSSLGVLDDLYRYDTGTATWTLLQDVGTPGQRERHGLAWHGGWTSWCSSEARALWASSSKRA